MRGIIGCAESGTVADALHDLGHEVMSCDLNYPSQSVRGVPHYQGDILDILYDGWDFMIVFPECKYLCLSGVKHRYIGARRYNPDGSESPICPDRLAKTDAAIAFVRKLWAAPIPIVILENSQMFGYAKSRIGIPESQIQVIRPQWFGVKETKAAHLHIRGTNRRMYATDMIEKPADPTPSERREWERCFRMPPDKPGQDGFRSKMRARTQPEVASAIAAQLIGRANLQSIGRADK